MVRFVAVVVVVTLVRVTVVLVDRWVEVVGITCGGCVDDDDDSLGEICCRARTSTSGGTA